MVAVVSGDGTRRLEGAYAALDMANLTATLHGGILSLPPLTLKVNLLHAACISDECGNGRALVSVHTCYLPRLAAQING